MRILDAGQGNAVLVRTPEHHALLFDGGPADCDLARQLRSLGVRRLDAVVLSHPHADHFAGLLQSLDAVEVVTLIHDVQVGAPAARAPPGGSGAAEAGEGSDSGTAARQGDEARLRPETLTHWMALAKEGRVDELFESVMVLHYDPCYRRSTKRNYGPRPATMQLALDSLEPAGLEEVVRLLVELDARESLAAPVVSK